MRSLMLSLALAAPAEPPVEFTNTGKDCRNLAIMGSIDTEAARELVPERFKLTGEGFVELATCPSGTIDGREIGPFRLAEAAVVIEQPAPLDDPGGTITQDIYAISQLDTNAQLSRLKRRVGFRSELVDIGFEASGPLGTHLEADIPWAFSPYTMSADISPSSPPLPITIVTRIWGLGKRGLVLTRNDIERVEEGSVAYGTASFAPGSPLARLFGTATLSGQGIAGRGTFTNVTRIIEPAELRAVVRRRRVRVEVLGAVGPFRATVRRGGRLIARLRGDSPLEWNRRDRRGRRVGPGTYRVRVGSVGSVDVVLKSAMSKPASRRLKASENDGHSVRFSPSTRYHELQPPVVHTVPAI